MDRLPYKKVRMLLYWSERSASHTPSAYDIDSYGYGLKKAAKEFLESGLLRLSYPPENVSKSTVSELQQFLKSKGEKHTGTKTELCKRILSHYTAEQLNIFFNSAHYVLTDSGNEQLSKNTIFFLNDKLNCGLTEFEIQNALCNFQEVSDYKIIIEILKSKLPLDIEQNEWNNYVLHLKSLIHIHMEYGEFEETVLYLWLKLYNELSGIRKPWCGEFMPRVDDISYVHLSTETIKKLDECICSLSWSLDDLKKYIINKCIKATPDYVFHYYSLENTLSIICDQLMGINFSSVTCKIPHNIPRTDSKEYVFYSSDKTDKEETIDEITLIKEQLNTISGFLLLFFQNNSIHYSIESVEVYSNCFEIKFRFHSSDDILFINKNHSAIANALSSPMIWTKSYSSLITSLFIVYPDYFYNKLEETSYLKSLKWYTLSIQ